MKLPKTHPRSGSGFVRKHTMPGLFSQSANEPPAGEGEPGGTEGGTGGEGEPKPTAKSFDQAEVNRIAAREKAAGRRAAEEALATSLGVSVEDAKKIIADHKAAEDAKLSEADRAKQKAEADAAEAAKLKNNSAGEFRLARIERALAAEEFPKIADDAATAKVVRMVDVALDASYDDVREAVKQLKTEFPALFEKAKDDGKGKKPPLPGSAPSGKPPAPTGNQESKLDAGRRRFQEANKNKRGFSPLDKQTQAT